MISQRIGMFISLLESGDNEIIKKHNSGVLNIQILDETVKYTYILLLLIK